MSLTLKAAKKHNLDTPMNGKEMLELNHDIRGTYSIPIIATNLPDFVICHCKRDCTVKIFCNCCMHGQPCMALFKCKGLCSHNGNMSGEQADEE